MTDEEINEFMSLVEDIGPLYIWARGPVPDEDDINNYERLLSMIKNKLKRIQARTLDGKL